mgnify:CR=1 FL=1
MITFDGVTKRYPDGTVAVDDLTLEVPTGTLTVFVGPSGCGKTTSMRMINRMIEPTSGTLTVDGRDVSTVNPVKLRLGIGYVIQSGGLMPHQRVVDNVATVPVLTGQSRREARKAAYAVLERVGLDPKLGDRYPAQLSGGQRQRVALARAIVTRPRVLLLDEPLSALDKALRSEMQVELRRIQREVGITTIFVTHDQEEALTLSDQIGILRAGRLVRTGPPRGLYHDPRDRFTASFLGEANFFDGTPETGGLRLEDGGLLPWPAGRAPDVHTLAVRPEEMTISPVGSEPSADSCVIRGELGRITFSGPTAVCHVTCGRQTFSILLKNSELADIPQSGPVMVSWPAARSMLIHD